MTLACVNHESTNQMFPTGGTWPWDWGNENVDPPRQRRGYIQTGPGWMFQILPYMEQMAVYNLQNTADIEKSHIVPYSCPARRGKTLRQGRYVLNDYASATP